MVKRILTEKGIKFKELNIKEKENKILALSLSLLDVGTIIDENNEVVELKDFLL